MPSRASWRLDANAVAPQRSSTAQRPDSTRTGPAALTTRLSPAADTAGPPERPGPDPAANAALATASRNDALSVLTDVATATTADLSAVMLSSRTPRWTDTRSLTSSSRSAVSLMWA